MNRKIAASIAALFLLLALGDFIWSDQFFPDLVATKSGEKIEGRITAESGESVTISVETPQGRTDRVIARSNIDHIVRAPGETPTAAPTKLKYLNAPSPDKRWEYSSGELLNTATSRVALRFPEPWDGVEGWFEHSTPLWAPDSKRFAFYHGQGRQHETELFQLRANEWKMLKQPGVDDEIFGTADKLVDAQLKRKGLPKNIVSQLRELWWKVQPERWVDVNTLIVHASLAERLESKELTFGGHFLFTLKFDEAGNWKIVKTHRMSETEIEKHHHSD